MNTCKLGSDKPRMVAHRGVSGLERENTCAAFVAAGNRSYFGIETDVHCTADGKYAVIHDDTTLRVSGVDLKVEETDLATLQQLTLKPMDGEADRGDLRIPTLAEYISICKKYEKAAVLELKNPMTPEAVWKIVEIVDGMEYLPHTIFITFALENLVALREKYPTQPAQYLIGGGRPVDADALVETLCRYNLDLDIYYRSLTKELLDRLHALGKEVNVWTVDNPEDARQMIEMGVDYITSNILE